MLAFVDSHRTALGSAVQAGTTVRAVVIINPGNPSGACLSRDDITKVVRFAERNNLVRRAGGGFVVER